VPTDDSIDDDDVQSHSSGAAALQHDTDYITGVPADVQVGAVEVAPDGSVHVAPDVAAATVDTPADTTVDTTELPVEAVAESAAPTDSSITSDDDVDMIEQSTVTTTTTDPVPDVHDEPVVETPAAPPAAAVHASKRTANVNSSGSSSSNSGNSNNSGSNSGSNSNTSGSTTGSGGTAGCKLLNDDVVLKFSQEDAPSSNNMLLRRVSCEIVAYTNAILMGIVSA
jgi:hypothetical protein